jgi:hypothetical protein
VQAIRAASAELGGLDGITTFCEMAVPLVARLTEAMGLPGNTPDAVDAARDKVGFLRECGTFVVYYTLVGLRSECVCTVLCCIPTVTGDAAETEQMSSILLGRSVCCVLHHAVQA